MPSQTAKRIAAAGLLLILLSGLFFATMIAAPFLPIGTSFKVMLAGAAFVCMQIAWWVGVALIGPEAIAKTKSWWNRLRNKSKQAAETDPKKQLPSENELE